MGWWKIKDVESGQIDWEAPTTEMPDGLPGGLINAIPGDSTIENHYNGDGPADLMTLAIRRVEAVLTLGGAKAVYKDILQSLFFEGSGYQEGTTRPVQDISWEQYRGRLDAFADIQKIVSVAWMMIRREYIEAWHREPYSEELHAVFNFCTNNKYQR